MSGPASCYRNGSSNMSIDKRQMQLALFFPLVLLGCATVRLYPGESLPKADVARLEFTDRTIVESIDGVVPSTPWYSTRTRYELQAGSHSMVVRYKTYVWELPLDRQYLDFRVEPAHRYKLRAETDLLAFLWTGNYWSAWVEDVDTGEIVGRTTSVEKRNQAILSDPKSQSRTAVTPQSCPPRVCQ
jgi:hypothetical protein